jgi:hypothetical protein
MVAYMLPWWLGAVGLTLGAALVALALYLATKRD